MQHAHANTTRWQKSPRTVSSVTLVRGVPRRWRVHDGLLRVAGWRYKSRGAVFPVRAVRSSRTLTNNKIKNRCPPRTSKLIFRDNDFGGENDGMKNSNGKRLTTRHVVIIACVTLNIHGNYMTRRCRIHRVDREKKIKFTWNIVNYI
jgi:hypothetical protein